MQTHGQCPWHKVPKFPRPPHPPHPPTAHRPLPARQLNMVQMEKRRIIPNGPCLFETVMAGDPPPETSTTPPPPAWPGQNQTRVAVVWLAVTALVMFKGSCPGVRKRAAPGVIQRHACGQASPTSRVPKSPCWRWLHGAGIFGESRENPKASWKHHELPNMSMLDPKSGKSC